MMISSRKILDWFEILSICWALVFGVAGIIIIGSGDGKTIPDEAWLCLGAMIVNAFIISLIRKEKRTRDHKDFLTKYPHMKGLYE